ncbi:MAG: hypothetical protein ACI92S_004059, partial [Planctomycetaceae bacterium]
YPGIKPFASAEPADGKSNPAAVAEASPGKAKRPPAAAATTE